MTGSERRELAQRISDARRAALGPDARPGHPSRFGFVRVAAQTGREVLPAPTLAEIDRMDIRRPKILSALNG